MAGENKRVGASPSGSPSEKDAPGTITAAEGETSEAGVPIGRAIPYSRYAQLSRERSQYGRENAQLKARVEELEQVSAAPAVRDLPDYDDDPMAHTMARIELLEKQSGERHQELTRSLTDMRDEEAKDRTTAELDRRLHEAMEQHPLLQDDRLSDLVQEHFWMTVTADTNASPEEVVSELADRFKGWNPEGGPSRPRTGFDAREALAGKPRVARTEPHLDAETRGGIISRPETWRERMHRVFAANREKRAEKMAAEERRLAGL